ncbi:MAG TPA: WD40 repeat domain-containing protein [Blastocatellia bacterium]|nr:WD40 repeat domain-containing protein [Blastocatellia bacterium]
MESHLNNPFIGLQSYEQKHRGRLFGRDKDLILMKDRIFSGRTTLLFAGSGVGKTSFLNAKVIPALSRGFFIFYYKEWAAEGEPLAAIKRALCDQLKLDRSQASQPLISILERFAKPAAPSTSEQETINQCLLILDQFEEIFQYHAYEPYFRKFIAELCDVVNATNLRARLVLSMREEFLGELSVFDNRIPDLFNNYYRLKYPDKVEAGDIIENTSELESVKVDEANLETLVEDLSEIEKGAGGFAERAAGGDASRTRVIKRDFIVLPYLQIACRGLWDRQFGPAQNGGVRSRAFLSNYKKEEARTILRQFCNDKLSSLRFGEQVRAARAFNFLVTKQGAKIAYELTRLAEHMITDKGRLQKTLEKLSAPETRILRESRGPDGSHWFELYHDMYGIIVDEWKRKVLSKVRRLAVVIAASFFTLMILVTVFVLPYWLYEPKNYTKILEKEDVGYSEARDAYLSLRDTLGYAGKAHKLWAGYWERRALQEELQQNHDAALRFWLESLAVEPEGEAATQRRARVAALEGGDYGSLVATFRQLDTARTPSFSGDGSAVLTHGEDGSISLWETYGGLPIIRQTPLDRFQVEPGHRGQASGQSPPTRVTIRAAVKRAWADGSEFLVAGTKGDKAGIWRADTGEAIKIFSTPKQTSATGGLPGVVPRPISLTYSLGFSPDGRYFAAKLARTASIQVWEILGDEKALGARQVYEGPASGFAFSQNGKLLATIEGETIRLWSLEPNYQPLKTISLPSLATAIVFSPGGSTFAVSTFAVRPRVRFMQVWSIESGQAVSENIKLSTTSGVFAFHPDGRTMLMRGPSQNILLRDVQSGRLLGSVASLMPRGEGRARSISASYMGINPDGEHVIASTGGVARLVKIDLSTPPRPFIDFGEDILATKLSSDGEIIATVGRLGKVQLWSGKTLQPLHQPLDPGETEKKEVQVPTQASIRNSSEPDSEDEDMPTDDEEGPVLALSPNGKFVAKTGINRVTRVWDVATGQLIREKNLESLLGSDSAATDVAEMYFSADGRFLAIKDSSDKVRAFETETLDPVPGIGSPGTALHVAFSDENSYLATAERAGFSRISNQINLWDLSKGTEVPLNKEHLPADSIEYLAFNGDRLVTCSGNIAQLWEVSSGHVVSSITEKPQNIIDAAAIGPDRRRAVTVSEEGVINLWDITTQVARQVGNTLNQKSEIRTIEFTDGNTFVTVVGYWAYTFSIKDDMIRHLSSVLLGSNLGFLDVEPLVTKVGAVKLLSRITSAAFEVRDTLLNSPIGTSEPTGIQSALQEEWQAKWSLAINDRGDAVPLYQVKGSRRVASEEPEPPAPGG